ncbi:MAG: DUF2089 family protein [Fimbriimonadales bacterium]
MSGNPITHDDLPAGLSDLGEWHISEFRSDQAQLQVKGRFKISPFQKLSADQASFLITFLRCRGVISSVEKELGISYPTVRSRLDALLKALDLAPSTDAVNNGRRELSDSQKQILEKLEAGDITPEEAKRAMKEAAK